jgi:hypothetical protein
MLTIDLLMAFAMARFAVALDVGCWGLTLLTSAVPFAIQPTYWNFAHAGEAVIICHALAFQAEGRRLLALTLVTVGCFVKPEMGYVYGFLLFIIIVAENRRNGFEIRDSVRSLSLVALIGIALSTLLILVFGFKPLFATLFPTAGIRAYHAAHYGFLHEGQRFWYVPGATWGFYLGGRTAFFLVGSAFVAVTALLVSLPTSMAGNSPNRTSAPELLICCAIMQSVFIVFMYGGAGSWSYYPYVLVIGLVAAARCGYMPKPFVLMLIVLAMLSNYSEWRTGCRAWKEEVRVEGTELWAPAQEAAEWSQIRALARGRRTVILNCDGGARVLSHDFGEPASLFLFPALTENAEVQRLRGQLAGATAVVGPAVPYYDFRICLRSFPSLTEVLDARFSLKWQGRYFQFYVDRNLKNGSY